MRSYIFTEHERKILLEWLKTGRRTETTNRLVFNIEMGKQCTCNIFNPARGTEILEVSWLNDRERVQPHRSFFY